MCGEIGGGELMCGEEECVQSCVAVWDVLVGCSVGCVAVSSVSVGCAEGDVAEDCVKDDVGCVSVGCADGDVAEDCAKGDVTEGKGVECVGIKGIGKGVGVECMPEACDVPVDKARDEINSCSLKCTCLEIQIRELTGS